MKKILSIVLFLAFSLSMTAGIHSYAAQSVLANGKWVKVSVPSSGVCRMSFDEIRAAGIEPTQLRVFGFGGGQLDADFKKSKIDDLPQVPVYVGSNYVLFYVQGPISWAYDGKRFVHTRNTYSDKGYYFLTDNVGNMLAPTYSEAVTGTPTEVTTFMQLQVHDKDSLNLVDRSGIAGGGKTFYGEQFGTNQRRTFSLATPNAVTSELTQVYIDLACYASTVSTFSATLNGGSSQSQAINPPSGSDHYVMAMTGAILLSGTSQSSQQQVQITFRNAESSSALGWLNYIEVNTPSTLRMTGDWMEIRTNEGIGQSTPLRYHLQNANSAIQIWDVTDLGAITRVPTTLSGTELQWTGSNQNGTRTYVAVRQNGSSYVSATAEGAVSNQNLHALSNIDYVIICPEGFEAESRRLAQAHQAKHAITWAVVTDQQVYNEFSSGTPDATAYRWLMKMLYDRANGNVSQKPRWLLLMGHGSFDNRGLLPNSGSKLLLTYQSDNSTNEVKAYASDDYFGWLDDDEGTSDIAAKMDIGVGRLPVESVEDASKVVDKITHYMENAETGKWKNQLAYLADDGDRGDHTYTAEGSAEQIRIQNPDFIVHKIYLDAYPQEVNASGESYPLAKNKVQNLLKNGVFFFDYSGHGGYNGVTSESVLNLKDIEKLNNKNLGFWLFVTCNFAQFDSGRRCAAEVAVMNPNGGAIGIIAATRTVYAEQNTQLNRAVSKELFKHTNTFHYEATIGEALMAGKNALNNDGNKLAYLLLGDPALRLNYPTDYWLKTTTQMDTLNALSVQHVNGQVVDEDSALVSDFNGKVDITVYDKLQVITTRDNDDKSDNPNEIPYNDYPNMIFSGSTEVKNGLFSYTFMVPKDIRYNYGNGRIVYYAHDPTYNEEAVGHFHDFIVGGTGSIVAADTTGPQMNIYLNNIGFKNGDRTYPTPRFFADLSDEHGINTAGAGIGHDLMLVVDNDPKQTYTLNEYFTAAEDSYQSGQVNYLMPQMANGAHSLRFRAWDLMNNSTTQTLNFIVEAGLDPSIYSVTTYPNPVRQAGILNIAVSYDQPDELIYTDVYISNINGQLLYSQSETNPDQISINMAELNLQPGVYMYTIRIKTETSKYSASSGKIIVTR